MKIKKNEWYVNKKDSKRYLHDIIQDNDGQLFIIYSITGLEKDMKENLYKSFLSWINSK